MTTLAPPPKASPPGEPTQVEKQMIDDDIQHTVERLFHMRPQQNNLIKGKKESTEEIVSRALQAERNHWKERLQLSLQEIDRQHRIILVTQSGLQDLVNALRYVSRRSVITEEEEEDEDEEDVDQELVMVRMIENLKFQIRQLKVRAGVTESNKAEMEDSQAKHKQNIKHLKESLAKLEQERDQVTTECAEKNEKVLWLQRENATLHRQLQKMSAIVSKYNENNCGTNFHLNFVDAPPESKRPSYETIDLSDGLLRERTYTEGDQFSSYPVPSLETAMIKDRLKKNIYSARKADSRSSNVAKCFRCLNLFKPAENNHRSCRFHHKGREIKEQFDVNGKLERVVYKWACCKKPLETPGCCYGYHV